MVPTVHSGSTGWASDSQGATFAGNRQYLSDGDGGLRIMDVSDPANPIFKGTLSTKGYVVNVQVVGKLASDLRIGEVFSGNELSLQIPQADGGKRGG